MDIIKSKSGIPIRLTEERWNHILTTHADMIDNKDNLLRTINAPDMVLKGNAYELRAVKFVKETRLGPKHLVVAYKVLSTNDGFIITAYKASNIRKIIKKGIL